MGNGTLKFLASKHVILDIIVQMEAPKLFVPPLCNQVIQLPKTSYHGKLENILVVMYFFLKKMPCKTNLYATFMLIFVVKGPSINAML